MVLVIWPTATSKPHFWDFLREVLLSASAGAELVWPSLPTPDVWGDGQNRNKSLQVLILKWTNDWNSYFSKDDIQMGKKHMKICSTSLIIRGCKTKQTKKQKTKPITIGQKT